MGAPVGNFNALKHGKRSPRKRAERLAAGGPNGRNGSWQIWPGARQIGRPITAKFLTMAGRKGLQQIRACTHDGTGAKPVIRARLLVRILFSASVSQRASLILSQKMNRASTPITVLPLVQQEGD